MRRRKEGRKRGDEEKEGRMEEGKQRRREGRGGGVGRGREDVTFEREFPSLHLRRGEYR